MDSSAIFSAVTWIATWVYEKAEFLNGVEEKVERLQSELEHMLAFLEKLESYQKQHPFDAEDPQLVIHGKTIQTLAFKAEDVIDNYILNVSSSSEDIMVSHKCVSFLKNFFCHYDGLRNIRLIMRTGNDIENIIMKAKEAHEGYKMYNLGPMNERNGNTSIANPYETYAHTEDDHVVGLDVQIQTLVEQLRDESKWIVGIVGQAGLGKTTLARKVFNHDDVNSHFQRRAWACISQQWSKSDILYEILRSINRTEDVRPGDLNHRELVDKISNILKAERYLIVLDDIWTTEAWSDIHAAIPHSKGSKVMITTRIRDVIRCSHTVPDYPEFEVKLLGYKDGWKLFSKIASIDQNIGNHSKKFEELGKEMLLKCDGLPLAIVTLAGLLRTQKTIEDWENINKACKAEILKRECVKQLIQLSYLHLPSHLKPCFLYLSVFPEDTIIDGDELTYLWMAERLVKQEERLELEDVAKRYLKELVDRCLLQIARINEMDIAEGYKLHDVVREFCITKAKDQCFIEVFNPTSELARAPSQARRAAFHSRISNPKERSNIRSFIFLFNKRYWSDFVHMSMNPVVQYYKLLRVLILQGIETSGEKDLDKIGELIHLRRLAITHSKIGVFPKTIGKLRHLLSLDLRWIIVDVGAIDIKFFDLTGMRHLHLCDLYHLCPDTDLLLNGLDKLRDLQTLYVDAGDWMIKEMAGLSNGIKMLKLSRPLSVAQLEAVYECPSIKDGSLQKLVCNVSWDMKFDVHKLEHCKRMKIFTLSGRINEETSVVNSLQFPSNIVHLELFKSNLNGEEVINDALGQLSYLKELHLGPNSFVGRKVVMRRGAFPQLETLMFGILQNWEEWIIEEGSLPCLKNLHIISCKNLEGLPTRLSTITTLQRLYVWDMPATFCKRLGEDDGINKHITIRNKNDTEGLETLCRVPIYIARDENDLWNYGPM